MHVDVLQSWSNQILEQEGVILRNEYEYNSMLIDDIVNVLPNNDGIKLEFTKIGDNTLNINNITYDTQNIILTTVGYSG